ncbi:uncharacterized protein Z518_06358 [Rhinocladiella mackenziei CBS 650.93]|uniref:Ryanodine receptor Ryr domain-containing protein n=1 Tax=Rhinocladiella mackenziei CBS 650.93 TaxID=1442369 RepID=A0A0D2IQP8_9EURO|nr:uncharacterized protein Z518_06358 [Rhinocladiella mackenziei CBS 650.93]KIX05486.1 hypothetical protein Z518_06358 [Rhinocladiella mackenziei CBS 650.93]
MSGSLTPDTPNADIVVAGDIPADLLVYPSPGSNSDERDEQKLRAHRCFGGAALIAELLQAAAKEHKFQVHKPSFFVHQDKYLEHSIRAVMELESLEEERKGPHGFKVKRRQQLYADPRWHNPNPEPPIPRNDQMSILIFQDAENDFANPDAASALFRNRHPDVLLYHMARHMGRPLGTGEIWDLVRRGPYRSKDKQDPERFIAVVSADDLRAEGIELCHGLSWEKTCEDFVEKLGSNGKLDSLATCAHLIVLFGCDGVIYHRGRKMVEPILFFDPLSAEGDFFRENIGYLPGVAEAFVGGLAVQLAHGRTTELDVRIRHGIEHGLTIARRLARLGFRDTKLENWPKYPVAEVMDSRLPAETIATLSVPSESISRGDTHWSILHQNIGDPPGVARQIVKEGTYSAATRIPLARFGRLVVFDRQEIEAFRTIFNSVQEYLSVSPTRPLNIGVFGSRGAGKSFAAMQVTVSAAEASGRKIRQLRFNLPQMTGLDDLFVAFNTVRDCSLSGLLPLVYINGFDTDFSGARLGWLSHLLAPMHTGQVLDRGEMRHIGPAILILGSNTVNTFEDFTATLEEEDDFPGGQEFLSCLHGFVNVLGLDRVNESDALYPVRRAVVLRALLVEREPNLKDGEGISIDDSVLDGLLMIPTFRHGLRSLKSIIATSKLTNSRHFERAALPPRAQLSLHLDYAEFEKSSQFNTLPESTREMIAQELHRTYIATIKAMKWTPTELQEQEEKPSMRPWETLDEEFKESARAHAIDLPRKLRMISCFLATAAEDRIPVQEFDAKDVERLAEHEHERWNAERLQKQWRWGERNDAARTSPFLVPWRDLEPKWQNMDRELVKSYPKILPDGYKIYKVGKAESINAYTFKGPSRAQSSPM